MSSSAFAEGQTSRMGQTGLRERPSGEVAACGEPTLVGCFFRGEKKQRLPAGRVGSLGKEGLWLAH